jgi:DNA uptake protein ComE-like DNA-binding protein
VTSSSSTAAAALAPAPKPPEAIEDKAVSINTASLDDLAKVKHLSRPLAKAIVAARPYQHVDELLRAKGIGPKLLKKIRSSVSV